MEMVSHKITFKEMNKRVKQGYEKIKITNTVAVMSLLPLQLYNFYSIAIKQGKKAYHTDFRRDVWLQENFYDLYKICLKE